MKAYVQGCDICLALKAIKHKPYGDLQFMLVLTHRWKNLSMDSVISLPISTDWKENSYETIFIIVDHFTKIVYYKLIKTTIDISGLVKVIIDVVVRYYGLLKLIISATFSALRKSFPLHSIYKQIARPRDRIA